MTAAPHLVVLGHGYSAGYLTRTLVAQGWTVTGTTRNDPARIKACGAQPLHWPGDEAALRAELARADAILVSAGPDAGECPALRDFGAAIAASPARWLGYLSTTGVYGDRQGGWVDEDSPLTPATRRGHDRVAAETAWQALAAAHGLPLHIFRLAGIYGPGRGPFAKVRAGTARRIIKPGQVFNRIHVEDIAAVLEAAARGRGQHELYNVTDGEPSPPQDVITYAAKLMGIEPPPEVPFESAPLSPMGRSFYGENRRVRSLRIRDDLSVRLRYPSYREGLAAILAAASNVSP